MARVLMAKEESMTWHWRVPGQRTAAIKCVQDQSEMKASSEMLLIAHMDELGVWPA